MLVPSFRLETCLCIQRIDPVLAMTILSTGVDPGFSLWWGAPTLLGDCQPAMQVFLAKQYVNSNNWVLLEKGIRRGGHLRVGGGWEWGRRGSWGEGVVPPWIGQ